MFVQTQEVIQDLKNQTMFETLLGKWISVTASLFYILEEHAIKRQNRGENVEVETNNPVFILPKEQGSLSGTESSAALSKSHHQLSWELSATWRSK